MGLLRFAVGQQRGREMIHEQMLRSILLNGRNTDPTEYRNHVGTHFDTTFWVMCMIMVVAEWDDIGTDEIRDQIDAWLRDSGTTLKSADSNPHGWWSRAWRDYEEGTDSACAKHWKPEYYLVFQRSDENGTRYAWQPGAKALVEKIVKEIY